MSLSSDQKMELKLLRESTRKFIDKEITPHYSEWEKKQIFPRELWNKMGEAGMLCVDVPSSEDGYDAPFRFSAAITEELACSGASSLAIAVSVHSDIVTPYVLHRGSDEQKSHWLPRMISGEAVGAIAMTEPGTGSDLASINTSAIKNNDHYLINGAKTFITNGQHADLTVIVAKTAPKLGSKGISLFLVDTLWPGFNKGKNLDKLGLHASDTSELFFTDLKVPINSLLGEEGAGFAYLMQELPRERLIIAALAIGASEGMLNWTLDYVTQRKAFKQTLGQFQNTRFKLAELKTSLEINRAFVDQCIERLKENDLDVATAAMAKLSTTEMQGQVADACLQMFGGYGYMMEYPIARAFADARVQRIYGGTSEIMKEIIARSMLGK